VTSALPAGCSLGRSWPRLLDIVAGIRRVRLNDVELAYVPFSTSWLNRIEAQFIELRN
jgi:hypothetical protein